LHRRRRIEVVVRIRSVVASMLVCTLAVEVSSGCFTYAHVDPATVVPGRDVHVELTDAGTVGLAALIGPGMTAMDGRVVAVDTASMRLAVSQTTDRRTIDHLWNAELVTVPRPFIDRIQQRKFSAGRTAALSAAIIAVALGSGLVAHQLSTESTSSGSHGGGSN
jgi:hypothetical protein